MIYSGRLFPDWEGDFFVGSLKFDMISRLERGGDKGLSEVERLFEGVYYRIRDLREAPDGSIWFLSVGDGEFRHLEPGERTAIPARAKAPGTPDEVGGSGSCPHRGRARQPAGIARRAELSLSRMLL